MNAMQEISFAEGNIDNQAQVKDENDDHQLLQEIQNRASLEIAAEDSLEKSKLPLTAGIQQKRDAKRGGKKDEMIKKIMLEHNLDLKERAIANKLNYEIPPLSMDK